MEYLKNAITQLIHRIGLGDAFTQPLLTATVLLLIALASFAAVKFFRVAVIPALRAVVSQTRTEWDDRLLNDRVLHALGRLIPPVIWYALLPVAFTDAPVLIMVLHKACLIYLTVVVLLLISTLLNALQDISEKHEALRNRPLKGVYQMLNLISVCVGIIIIISILVDKDASAILTGLGASAAILMLIFKDTILGLVAGVQLSANDMLRPGDWIKMPKLGIDGVVTEVNMTIVKVLNWDNTVTTIPPYTLVSDSFENWRVMQESGGRRVKRSLNIDMQSVRFCTAEERAAYEGEEWYAPLKDESKLVNLTAFRAYFTDWLRHQDRINQDLILMIRQLQPTGEGLPLEFYFFSADRSWVPYEMLQAEVFEYILAVLPRFGLRVFQFPTGLDVKSLTAGGESQPQ